MKFTFNNKHKIEVIGNHKITPVRLLDVKVTGVFLNEKGKTIQIGLKPKKDITVRKLRLLIRQIIQLAHTNKTRKTAITFKDFDFPDLKLTPERVAEIFATEAMMANYVFSNFKEKPEKGWNVVEEIIIIGTSNTKIKEAVKRGRIIGEEVNKARTLSNMPGGSMTPAILARKANEAVKKLKIKVKILNEKDIKKLKMGAVLGVAQGSSEKPRFIIMEYLGGKKSQKPIVLVGKGVTFDTGGINIKPAGPMTNMMNMDMSGGAAVIQTIALAARLKLKKNIVVLVPAVENMPSGSSYRPGDILRGMSGKTIEVLNTDAEGRLILSDALTYAKRYKPSVVIDVATLTGAAAVALGQECSGVFTPDDNLAKQAVEAGEEAGDYVWRLPLWAEHEEYIKGTFGDVTNINNEYSRYGGATNAAAFLWQFAKEHKTWMHIDIAPRMIANQHECLAKGAAGAPVRMLLELIEKL